MSWDEESDSIMTADELFSASFQGDYEDEQPWDAVRVLRRRDSDQVFQTAAAYCRSEIPIHRARALDVLAQLGAGKPVAERHHFNDSVSIAAAHLDDEDPLVARSAAWALAHLQGERAISSLISLSKCADAQVRRAVAVGMAGSDRPDAINTLVELMEDDDDEVRNWATFGLGNVGFGSLDSPDIREALRRRLNDSFSEVRDEAVWGLARRRDPAALRLLMHRLNSEEWIDGDEMAAAEVLGLDYDAPVETLLTGLTNLVHN